MKPIEEIFYIYKPLLPESWNWCTIFFMTGSGRSIESTTYGFTSDREQEEINFNSPTGTATRICELMNEFAGEIASTPLQQPSHIELTLEPDGKYNTVIGYGEPNWDPAPRPWPDDITAEEYTYTKAWPNGIKEKSVKRLKDPRSLIGLVINK